jgi:hypothetical protein
MSCTRRIPRVLCLSALCGMLALPAMAQPTIQPGIDTFSTPADGSTVVDFSNNPIPAGFFCTNSAPFAGAIALKGVPLATVPAGITGGADTIVERLGPGFFNTAGTASFPIVLRALRLTGINTITVDCPGVGPTTWRVDVCACGLQPTGKLTAKIDPACGTCGTASGNLLISACARFTNLSTGQTVGPITQNINLAVNNMKWCYRPGPGQTVVTTSFGVDSNCDGQPDLTLPPMANFHPGRSCPTQNADCWTVFAALTTCHENYDDPDSHDHCVNPVCGRQ